MATTLNEGWDALEGDLVRQGCGASLPSLRHAFRHGAAMILNSLLAGGPDAIVELFDSRYAMTTFAAGAAVVRRDIHPEWTDTHCDCMICGAQTMLIVMRTHRPEEVDHFRCQVDGFEDTSLH